MRKSVAVLGPLLLGVTPTLAAGQQLNAAVPAQEEVVQVVVPEEEGIPDNELNEAQFLR